jgi:hypothetical protein
VIDDLRLTIDDCALAVNRIPRDSVVDCRSSFRIDDLRFTIDDCKSTVNSKPRGLIVNRHPMIYDLRFTIYDLRPAANRPPRDSIVNRQSSIVNLSVAAKVLLLLFMISFTLHAQGSGVVEGKLVNGTDPRIVGAGIDLEVIRLGGGMTALKSAVTDSAGRFRIEDLPTDAPLLVRANYKSVNYHGRVDFAGSNKATVEIEIYETTTSMQGIRVEDVRLGFKLEGEHLLSLETCSFVNETNPKKTFMSMEGNFRFSKASGIESPPQLTVTGPGAAMPLNQPPLESSDGQSYYSLYPLRPGKTRFELEQTLPYHERSYTYRKKFYHDIPAYQIGVIPLDMELKGEGLQKFHADKEKNFAFYSGSPVKAGTEVAWVFAGGTPVAAGADEPGESRIKPFPTEIGQRTLLIGPLLLMTLIAVLWYAYNRIPPKQPKSQDPRVKELRDRRDRLLNLVATLDRRYEDQALERADYLRMREQAKSQLRRIGLLLGKK